jgi:hypothetical protein
MNAKIIVAPFEFGRPIGHLDWAPSMNNQRGFPQ